MVAASGQLGSVARLWGAKNASGLGLPVDGAEAGKWSRDRVGWVARCVDGVLGVVQGQRKLIVRPPP
jgi:hypothetical protein